MLLCQKICVLKQDRAPWSAVLMRVSAWTRWTSMKPLMVPWHAVLVLVSAQTLWPSVKAPLAAMH